MVKIDELIVFILGCFCTIAAVYQAYVWFMKYSNATHQTFKVMFEKGFFVPRFINAENEDIEKDDAKTLNRTHLLIYLFMLLGIGNIVLHSILF